MGNFSFSLPSNFSFSLPSILILLLLTISTSHLADSTTYWGDIQVLKQLKHTINSASIIPGSCISSWNFSFDPCDHLFSEQFTCGFRCDIVVSGFNRITELTLDSAGYSGSLSSSLWNLPYLTTLDVSNNFFSGSIPDSLSNLTRLRQLALSMNSFSGEIPSSIGSLLSLEELHLDNNNLQGPIPSSINNLSALKRLELQRNNFSSKFPHLGRLEKLSFLDISDNSISGRIPATLPKSLAEISMRNNSLEGNLLLQIGDLGYLQVLDLSHNQVTGTVLAPMFDHPSLQQLTLSHNKFTSLQQPSKLGAKSVLIALDLSFNELQGTLPAFFPTMLKLSSLSLENNKLTGMIPTQYAVKTVVDPSIGGSSKFVRLLLGGNYLSGPIPAPLMKLKPGDANVSLGNNCLFRCPLRFFFCQGGVQKSSRACKRLGTVIS